MDVQLLLLLALVGPFCHFTHASPTTDPTVSVGIIDTTEGAIPAADTTKEDLAVVTSASSPVIVTEATPEEVITVITGAASDEMLTSHPLSTEGPVITTEASVDATTAAAPEPLNTDPPAAETIAPTDAASTEAQPAVRATTKETLDNSVVIEEPDESLSSGQVAGIVIGALLAVVIVIAIVIAVLRRMGKYSP